MITKPFQRAGESSDPRQRAGQDAERQMAHYLQRAFAQDPAVYVHHDLRLVDAEQPEPDGSPGVCQIDHLVVHRWGMFIIESKSVCERVQVRSDGSGGDEWTRVHGRKSQGMQSPIQQARRQGDFMRTILVRHRAELRGKLPVGTRTLARLVLKTDQKGFRSMPIQLVVAVSDQGQIERVGGWTEPQKPFRVFVCKADQVETKLRDELAQHRSGAQLLPSNKGEYGIWSMTAEEAEAVAAFLAGRHVARERERGAPSRATGATPSPTTLAEPAPSAVAPPAARARCKQCQSEDLAARWGKYGYYWKCGACGTNTPMPVICSACGAQGRGGKVVRIRKSGAVYERVCEACGKEERVWVEGGRR